MKRLIVLIVLAGLGACASGDKIPEDVIQPEKMKVIVWDLLLAEQRALDDTTLNKLPVGKERAKGLTSTSTSLFNEVFAIHKTDKNTFYKSYAYYEGHPDKLKLLMDSVSAYATRKRTDLYKRVE